MDYQRLYEYRFRGIDQGKRDAVWRPVARFVHDRLGRPLRVLDPAAGRGEFINAVPARERWAVDRVDFEDRSHRNGVRFVTGDVMRVDLPDAYFDGVFVSNFLEHLPSQDTIAAFLERMHAATAPGGRIAVMGPNFVYCARKYWDCADHHVALTHVAVEEHLYAAGFEPVNTIPRFLPYSFRDRLPATRRLAAAYLKTPLLWRLLGQQFLIVADH